METEPKAPRLEPYWRHVEGRSITAASTFYNENMQSYLEQHVHLVKEDRGPDHWLSELPSSVRIVVDKARSTNEGDMP